MTDRYLTTAFKDREQVKALGARWDAQQRRWYVPEGRDLSPFAVWLPAVSLAPQASLAPLIASESSDLALPGRLTTSSTAVAAPAKGMPLSTLMSGIAQAVSAAYLSGVWTTVEVMKADPRNGHVYLELGERDCQGTSIAQARAVIWASTANDIVPRFERATGVVLGAGIKLLVRARPTVHPLYGMSLVIDAIDPDYTLGDLEAKKREIRQRLQREGLFDTNRALPPPWDYQAVLVIAPQGAAGLGDFQAEAGRLQRLGICRFEYRHSRFQGEGAAAEILKELQGGMARFRAQRSLPDAVVIIRGGGAVNDLAWLNDYALARAICELAVPVLTGIGHERDSTVLDEVAQLCFDTPSKVIAGIEQAIGRRVQAAKSAFEQITRTVEHVTQAMRREIDQADAAVQGGAWRQLASAREQASERLAQVRVGSLQSVRDASEARRERLFDIRHQAMEHLSGARQQVPTLLAEVRSETRQALLSARSQSKGHLGQVLERSAGDARRTRLAIGQGLVDVAGNARRLVAEARDKSQATLREIAGQGPDQTLGRGFAIVRNADGKALTRAADAPQDAAIDIRFHDGSVPARTLTTPPQQK